jgi:hypothetical protein
MIREQIEKLRTDQERMLAELKREIHRPKRAKSA